MSASNRRIKQYNTAHHLTSRIAHRVYFLKDDERNDFLEFVFRVSDFSGVELIGWTIMENHFHLYVYLPEPPSNLTVEEIVSRYERIAGIAGRNRLECDIRRWKAEGACGEEKVRDTIKRLRMRMYSIAWFMKMTKQWFTENYNRRTAHKGTLWEATYHDRVISAVDSEESRDCLAYIHLNPIRAAITAEFDAYPWSSLHSFKNGAARAAKGMRLAYDNALTADEMLALHHERMLRLLEAEKLKRADEIAKRRLAGYEIPHDHLTDEAMIAQAAAHIKKVQDAVIELHAEREVPVRASERRTIVKREIAAILAAEPGIRVEDIARRVGKPTPTVYRYLRSMRNVA